MAELTGGEAVVETLKALGVTHVFGIVSVHNLPIYDAIERLGGLTAVPVRHEQGAVHAADGLARATGRLGVAITSTGPGAANGMTGLFEAAFASSPVLMLTGQIESRYYGKGKGFLHEAERQLPMLASVVRRAETVRRTAEIPQVVARVGIDCLTGRRQPGAVEIPIDLQYAKADVMIPSGPELTVPQVMPDSAALDQAAETLRGAKRPLIWIGGGVVAAGAGAALGELADKLDAPVVSTINGRGGMADDDRRCLGATTLVSQTAAIVAEADVILAVGTRFQAGATNQWSLPVPGKIVHIDADASVIGRNYPATVAVIADARLALEGLNDRIDSASTEGGWFARARVAGDEARAAMVGRLGDDWAALMDGLRAATPRDAVIVRDATVPAYLWGDRLLPIYEPRTSMNPTSAAIGPALPLGIGAALGSGKRTVILHGDGGIMLNLSELATAAQTRAPIVVCVFNDGGYGILRFVQAANFEGRQTGVDLTTPDFAAVAEAMGVTGEHVKGVDGFIDALTRAVDREGPTLLDIDMASIGPLGFGRR